MLEIEMGAPGAGKTYNALANRILPAAMAGRKVVTNVPVIVERLEAFKQGASHYVEVHDTRDGWGWWKTALTASADCEAFQWRNPHLSGQGPLVVIDECREIIHAKEKALPEGMESFFSRHRHAGLDIVLITQNMTDVYMPIRKLAATCWVIRNLGVIGAKGRYWRVCYDSWTMKNRVGGVQWGRYNSDIWTCYESFTGGGGAFERKQRPAWQSPRSALLLVMGAVAIWQLMMHPAKKIGGAVVSSPIGETRAVEAASPSVPEPRGSLKGDDFEKLLTPDQRAELARLRFSQEKRRLHMQGQMLDVDQARVDDQVAHIPVLDDVAKPVRGQLVENGDDPARMRDPRLKLVGWIAVGGEPSFWVALRDGDHFAASWTKKRFEAAGYIVEYLREGGFFTGVRISGKGHEWELVAD